jgi:hypothetical protein
MKRHAQGGALAQPYAINAFIIRIISFLSRQQKSYHTVKTGLDGNRTTGSFVSPFILFVDEKIVSVAMPRFQLKRDSDDITGF